jgi:hypothetical protein
MAPFADDDPGAPVEPDPRIQRIGTVYHLSEFGKKFKSAHNENNGHNENEEKKEGKT